LKIACSAPARNIKQQDTFNCALQSVSPASKIIIAVFSEAMIHGNIMTPANIHS
jgi:hypothetical protein